MPDELASRKIELQKRQVEDMLGRVPSWITRNGMIMFLVLLMLLIFGSWVFKYPDIKRATILVTSANPAADIEARTSGKITDLFVTNNGMVKVGDVLAMIENPASYEDIIKLKSGLLTFDSIAIEDVTEDLPDLRNAQLGTVQTDYSIFLKAYRDYIEFRRLDYHQRRIVLLRSELVRQKELAVSLSNRARIAEEEYNLAQRQANRDADLYIESVVSESDMEKSHSAMLAQQNLWQEIVSLVAENNISVGRIEEQIVDLQLKQQEDGSNYLNLLEESLNNLNASLASWEQTYLLVAPVSGSVSFTRFWSENQNVEVGEKVLTIIPSDAGSMIGKIKLPTAGAGKVKPDQQVNILFDNYPHLQFGMVRGKVISISEVPDNDFYTVEVSLPNGLLTFYKFEIPFSQNMQGQAEILTDKKRILERVLDPIKSVISKQVAM